MKDKEKQIEEMAKCMCHHNNNGICELLHTPCDGDCGHIIYYLGTAEKLSNLNYQKVDKDSIVLSREKYERLSSSHDIVFCDNKDCPDNLLCRCCEISECPKNIPEYNEKLSVNKHKLELFQKLCKERERVDIWEDRYKLLEEELKQERKEMAEKAFEITKKIIDKKYAIETPWTRATLSNIINQIEKEFAKQFGVEIKD